MNKLANENLHLLLDEPIYVLADHGDHPEEAELAVNEEQPEYSGGNSKGISIYADGANEEDLLFLFKGLNALNIYKADVAIFSSDYDSLKQHPPHTRRLRFSKQVILEQAFDVIQNDELTVLSSIPLNEIRSNQDFKRKFWEVLKVIFKTPE